MAFLLITCCLVGALVLALIVWPAVLAIGIMWLGFCVGGIFGLVVAAVVVVLVAARMT